MKHIFSSRFISFRPYVIMSVIGLFIASMTLTASGRRVKVPAATKGYKTGQAKSEKTFTVDSLSIAEGRPNPSGRGLDAVEMSRFDKPVESRYETFFVTNRAATTLTAVTLRIDYYTSGGEKMHSRTVTAECNIPPGETRQLSVPSFDRQQTYRYQGSRIPPRRPSTPFTVRLTPLRLRYTL